MRNPNRVKHCGLHAPGPVAWVEPGKSPSAQTRPTAARYALNMVIWKCSSVVDEEPANRMLFGLDLSDFYTWLTVTKTKFGLCLELASIFECTKNC